MKMRDATPSEAAEDYKKREAALESAIERGLYSERQAKEHRAELEEFKGYPRPVGPEPIARVHVGEFDPEVYRGEHALEYALAAATKFRGDFPGAIVGVSYNPEAAAEKKADLMARLGITEPDKEETDG